MNWNMFIPIALGCMMANVAVRWIYFKILKVAFDKKLVDNPDARKLQKRPVTVVGGLAVFLSVLAGVGIINAINMIDSVNSLSSGLCITCCCLFGVAFVKAGDVANAVVGIVYQMVRQTHRLCDVEFR